MFGTQGLTRLSRLRWVVLPTLGLFPGFVPLLPKAHCRGPLFLSKHKDTKLEGNQIKQVLKNRYQDPGSWHRYERSILTTGNR